MVKRVKYTCKNCGWETSIREEWGDIRPKRCMNKKCNTSFAASPESLIIDRPKKKLKVEDKNVPKPSKNRSGKTVKQSSKKQNSEQHKDKGE